MTKSTIAALKRAGIAIPEGATILMTKIPAQAEPPKQGRNKYGAKPKVYNGVRYASTAEADRARALDEQQAMGLILWWIGQPKFRLGCPENIYVADALVVCSGGVTVEDVKGQETAKFKRDKKLWRAYGPCPLHIIKGGKVAEVIPGKQS